MKAILRLLGLSCVFLLLLTVLAHGQSHQVSVGDTLFISVWGEDELSGPVLVGPDGTISLPPPAGILNVERLTIDEVTQLLTNRLGEYLKNPRITVAIRESEGMIVHIYGQVIVPGFYKVPDNTSLQEGLTRAGGMTEYADWSHVQIRHQEDGQVQIREVNFRLFLEDNLLSANPTIGENDTVFVPRLDEETYQSQRVRVLGAVQSPGMVLLDTPRPLLDVLTLAGGPEVDADLAHVHLLRSPQDPQSEMEVDLVSYLSGASSEGNPLVEPGQAVFVPSNRIPQQETYLVNVVGQVVRPGAYPVTKRTRLLDAIYLAGGFGDKAQLDQVALIRSDGKQQQQMSRVNVGEYLMGQDLRANPVLVEGDTILVPIDEDAMLVPPVQRLFLKSISVNLIGEVRNPGTYEFSQRGGILDALTIAGGPTPDADLKRAVLLRGGSTQEQIRFNLEEVLTEGVFGALPTLQANDTLFIPMRKESRWRQFVRAMADFSTIAITVLILIEGRRP